MLQLTIKSHGRFLFYLRKFKGRISLPCLRRHIEWSSEIVFRFSTSRISHYLIALPTYHCNSTPADLLSGQFSGSYLWTGDGSTSLGTCEEIVIRVGGCSGALFLGCTFERFVNIIIFSGFAVQRGLWPPRPLGFLIIHNDASQSVGLIWTRDKLVAETFIWQHTQETNIHASGGIRTHDRSRRAAVGLC
jgi:hypothetical protein